MGKLEDLIAKIKADVQIRKIPNRRHRGHTTKEELHELDSRLSTELNSRLWLKAVGRALCLFTTSLPPPQDGCGFKRKGMQWVYDPNFVGVTIHSTREWNITLSLRGTPDEFAEDPNLPLKTQRPGYSRCKVQSARQLAAAANYIERAFVIWHRGRDRLHKTPRIEER